MSSTIIESYGSVLGPLIGGAVVMPLGPGRANGAKRDELTAMSVPRAFEGQRVADEAMARACLAGVWLLHDFLDESHAISQSIETTTGSYWHAIMHRREPDYANARYWFRRVGEHPIDAALAEAAQVLASRRPDRDVVLPMTRGWDPFAFVELVESCERGRCDAADLAQQIQMREWWLLFDHCYRAAIGADPA